MKKWRPIWETSERDGTRWGQVGGRAQITGSWEAGVGAAGGAERPQAHPPQGHVHTITTFWRQTAHRVHTCLYQSAWAAIIKYHRLDGLSNRIVHFSQFWGLEVWDPSSQHSWVLVRALFLTCRQSLHVFSHGRESVCKREISLLIRPQSYGSGYYYTSWRPFLQI